MSAGEVRQAQILPFIFTIKDQDEVAIDVSSASVMKLRIYRPDNSMLEKSMTLNTTGVDGKVKYVTGATDLDQVGDYQMQAWVTISGVVYPSDIYELTVLENLPSV